MAVALDATGTVVVTTNTTSASSGASLTVGSSLSNGGLFVTLDLTYTAGSPPTGISVTWGGASLTQVGSFTGTVGNDGLLFGLYVYFLANPASGAQTLAASWTNNATDVYMCGISFSGVNQATGANNATTNTAAATNPATITVSSATGNEVLVVWGLGDGQHKTATSDNLLFYSNGANNYNGAATYGAGSSSKTLTLTVDNGGPAWTALGVNILAAGGAALTLAGAEGSFTISGLNAALNKALKLAGSEGAFVISGQAAAMLRGITVGGAQGSFTISGNPATLKRGITLGGAEGAFTINGQAAVLSHGVKLAGAEGAFAISGQSSKFPVALSMKGAAGAFSISGAGAVVTYTPVGGGTSPHSSPFFSTPAGLTSIP